jgi:hypothetical protein
MSVTVSPETFRFVKFDSAVVARVARELVDVLGIDRPVCIEIDETTPLGRVRAAIDPAATGPITISVESGAFEDSRRPREQSEVATAVNLGRILLRVRDRLHGGFGEAPADDDLQLRQLAAWETYCAGRLSRLGLRVNQQRWRYNFRNRHGFTDEADDAFNQVWSSDGLTWAELSAICESAS